MSLKLSSQSKYYKVRTVSGSRLCRLLLLNAGYESLHDHYHYTGREGNQPEGGVYTEVSN